MNGYTNQDVGFQSDDEIKTKQKNIYFEFDVTEAKEQESDSMIVNEWIATKLADGFDFDMDIPGDIIADTDNTESVDESESSNVEDEAEELLYNSEESEMESESDNESDVLSNIKELASRDNELIVKRTMESYKAECGEYPSIDLLETGLYTVGRSLLNDYQKESETEEEEEEKEEVYSDSESDVLYENEDVMSFSDELESALSIASKMGSVDQEYLADKVLMTYYEVNQKEASFDELSNIFKNVKSEFQYEAMDDILDIATDNESDDDYVVTKNDIIQAVLDGLDSEDEACESECENESETDDDSEDEQDDSDNDSSYDPSYDLQDYSADYELYE